MTGDSGADNNRIVANVLSANDGSGVFIAGMGNTVRENLIGTDVTGTVPLGNGQDGVTAVSDADNNRIVANVLSANVNVGVWFGSERGTNVESDRNLVLGNLIGTDVNGRTAPGMGNGSAGVYVADGGTANVLAGNLLAGNGTGAAITGTTLGGPDGTRVEANVILQNSGDGLHIDFSSANIVRRNRIQANGADGIRLGSGGSNNSVLENFLRNNLEHDCHDDSVGSGTAGTANTWRRNNGQTSQPPGLCLPRG